MRVPVPEELLPADRLGRVHFVGIGGAGLSGIARIMIARGITVSGSDAKESRALEGLRALGARCYVGHDAAQVQDADTLVVSTAVREDNPEVVEAQRLGLRVLPRSAALESVMQGRQVVAVAGTHGKTTTTSLLTVALQHCSADPSFAIGGELNESGSNAHDGVRARSSSPRPTRATVPSWSTRRTAPWSPTSRPTTSTTTAPRRPTTPPSRRSWTGSTRPASWSCAWTTPAPRTSRSRPVAGA